MEVERAETPGDWEQVQVGEGWEWWKWSGSPSTGPVGSSLLDEHAQAFVGGAGWAG